MAMELFGVSKETQAQMIRAVNAMVVKYLRSFALLRKIQRKYRSLLLALVVQSLKVQQMLLLPLQHQQSVLAAVSN